MLHPPPSPTPARNPGANLDPSPRSCPSSTLRLVLSAPSPEIALKSPLSSSITAFLVQHLSAPPHPPLDHITPLVTTLQGSPLAGIKIQPAWPGPRLPGPAAPWGTLTRSWLAHTRHSWTTSTEGRAPGPPRLPGKREKVEKTRSISLQLSTYRHRKTFHICR